MSAKAIREATGKDILNRHLLIHADSSPCKFATVTQETNWTELVQKNPWLETTKLVVKPDQLIKRRGKYGLIAINKTLAEVKKWVEEREGKDIKIDNCEGKLRNFIIEPFLPHKEVSFCLLNVGAYLNRIDWCDCWSCFVWIGVLIRRPL